LHNPDFRLGAPRKIAYPALLCSSCDFPSPADMVLNKGVAWKLEKEESDKN